MKTATTARRVARREADHAASQASGYVLDLWERGVARHETCAAAVVRLIMVQPELIGRLGDPAIVESCLRAELKQNLDSSKRLNPFKASNAAFWFSALAEFLELSGRTDEVAAVYREGLDYLKKNRGADHSDTHGIALGLDRFLRRLGREKEASALSHELRVEPLLARNDATSLLALRDAAYEAYVAGSFAEAEAIYLHLLARNFETAGTHCHLARVLLALGRDAEATVQVNRAWACRAGCDPYVVARILYFKALLATLAGQDAQTHLIMLKAVLLHTPGGRHPWLLTPVLERLQSRLTPVSHQFFTQLARAMSGESIE